MARSYRLCWPLGLSSSSLNGSLGRARWRSYYPFQESEARHLVRNVLAAPSSVLYQTKLRIGTMILRVIYGYYIKDEKDPFLALPVAAMKNLTKALASALRVWLVDFISQLNNVPKCMPGSKFLSIAKEWRKIAWDAFWDPSNCQCKVGLETGITPTPNLCGNITFSLRRGNYRKRKKINQFGPASAIMGGGLDPNMSSALSLFDIL
ncbi:hypothetical protein CERSUDRAFT_96412 [Gelatoporia subvermispora B]|uniref:Uncharacterized protein n=1 Tax=Ceriporiopsis subvermispora (strain B) TaxID=914234 RepID=M2PGX9_CERS8|nr:hypothetical protein CERSUDRAFT_96412 [Gelatoporia subvermispora B]